MGEALAVSFSFVPPTYLYNYIILYLYNILSLSIYLSLMIYFRFIKIRPHRFGGEGVLIGGQQQH